ncbi:TonB-dependent siderophore receptor [Methylobacillus caricis]|uniref:TonB-dependent siderophore receptor n=1 Tax=Methylobacillus caricis TaxID=1971611 RepID=UPI001CFFEB0E|nr:TonB-dependent siderophore receptor [Methylobacillus caricis]MCB5189004.1 TonB-dependent siderophore receptor [Methylobacillus caricis]
MQSFHLKQKPLAIALRMLLAFSSVTFFYIPQSAKADTGSQAESQHAYDIPAGSLTSVLNNFAQAAGVVLSFDPALTAGKTSNGLKGSYTIKQGFDALLRDTGLQAIPAADGGYTLKKVTLTSVQRDADVLPEVAVTTRNEADITTENSRSYTSNRVAIGKGAQRLRDIPQSISIVTRQRIEDQNMTTVAEAMEQTSGVTVVSYGSGTNAFMMRGYQIQALQVDGIAVNTDQGTWGNSSYDLATYDRVEVLRGAAGLLQGAGEPGGTINLVRKRALSNFAIKTNFLAGSWDTYRGEFDITGALDGEGRLRGRLVAAYDDRGSFIDHVNSRKPLLYGTLEYDLAPNTTVSAGVTIQNMDVVPTIGLPTYPDGGLPDISRSTFIGARWDNKTEHSKSYFVELERKFETGGEAKLRLSALDRDMDVEFINGNGYIDRTTGNFATRSLSAKTRAHDYGMDAYVSKPLELMGSEHQFMLGINSRIYRFSTNYAYAGGPTQNIFDPDNDIAKPDFVFDDPSITKTTQTGIYGRAILQVLENTKLVLGGRLSNWKTEDKNNPLAHDNITQKFTPYTGLIVDVNQQFSVYGSYSDIFVPQTAQKADFSILKPRVGKQAELGIKGEFDEGRLNMHAAIFRIIDENRPVSDPSNPDFSLASGKVRSQGFESEISGRVMPKLDLMAGYAYTDTKYLDAEETLQGARFAPNNPKHLFKLWSKYKLSGDTAQGWSIGGGLNINSGVYAVDGDTTWKQGGYTLASLQVAYHINPHWDLSLTGNNLFDKKYFSKVEGWTRQTYFGEPRNFMLTLRGSF